MQRGRGREGEGKREGGSGSGSRSLIAMFLMRNRAPLNEGCEVRDPGGGGGGGGGREGGGRRGVRWSGDSLRSRR